MLMVADICSFTVAVTLFGSVVMVTFGAAIDTVVTSCSGFVLSVRMSSKLKTHDFKSSSSDFVKSCPIKVESVPSVFSEPVPCLLVSMPEAFCAKFTIDAIYPVFSVLLSMIVVFGTFSNSQISSFLSHTVGLAVSSKSFSSRSDIAETSS